jgi:hypothetical protein
MSDFLDDLNFRKGRGCWPPEDPYSTDPVVWARAYLRSLDWMRPSRTAAWFANAMATGLDPAEYDSLQDED